MSRWGKSRTVPSYALPLDALLKEKENTNRPVAARSAGTVGKWGVTSFTSMRARPVYGFASFSPNQDASLQYSQFSPKSLIEGGITNTVQSPTNTNSNTVAKPKKFFKSRNSVPDANALVAALSESQVAAAVMGSPSNLTSYYSSPVAAYQQQQQEFQQHHQHSYAEKTKRKKKSGDSAKKLKAEKPPKVEKVAKPPKPEKLPKASKKKPKANEKTVEASKPTRVLSRTRKIVNYSEDQSRSPPRSSKISNDAPNTEHFSNDVVTSSIHGAETISNNNYNSSEHNLSAIPSQPYQDEQQNSGDSPSKHCGPPIVLRISKGTSRLISTDSEGITGSPPYLSPTQQNPQQSNPNYSAPAALVAVLSDDSSIQKQSTSTSFSHISKKPQFEQNTTVVTTKTKREKAKPKAEPIKLKIKTNARLRNNSDLVKQQTEELQPYRARITRRTTPQHTDKGNLSEEKVPAHGTANYELYRTLTESPPPQPQPDLNHSLPEYQNFTTSQLNQANIPLNQSPEIHAQTSNTNSDTERGILPKKRRGRNKTKFEANTETIQKEPVQKKQRGRRKHDDQLPIGVTEAAVPSNEFVNIYPSQNLPIEEVSENYPKKQITAAAKKQYKDEDVFSTEQTVLLPPQIEDTPHTEGDTNSERTTGNRRGRRAKGKVNQNTANTDQMSQSQVSNRPTRTTRHTANGNMIRQKDQNPESLPFTTTRSYGRKRKLVTEETSDPAPVSQTNTQLSSETTSLSLPKFDKQTDSNAISLQLPFEESPNDSHDEQKKLRNKIKRQNQNQHNGSHDQQQKASNNNDTSTSFEVDQTEKVEENFEKPVKLVISKKKGSIFKSRAIEADSGESTKQKRHVYKHKWDDDSPEEKGSVNNPKGGNPPSNTFEADFDMDDDTPSLGSLSGSNSNTLSKFTRNVSDDDLRIRNVKKAHQMQEIGEFQEMDDDVEYILESLKYQNPIATRSLAAIQLALKCMTPAFRMHVRAHGTATKFFNALHDATQNQSLGLCTATIMFVLIQDNLNMDLDKHSLELMLNLLDSDISRKNNYKETGLTDEQSQRNEQKVIEICREIKNQGKAEHLNLDKISIGTLAMETLLTLTSKRAGEWFKDEMRKLGGLEHIINTICECCKQISDYVMDWTETLLEKLRKIERCLRVLENVSERNEENQKYILHYKNGEAIETLVKFYKLCDSEIALFPTNDASAAGEAGVVLREALVPTLKVLINLTHTFNNKPLGSVLFGQKPIIFETCLHLLFQAHQYIPEKCVFELSLLVLLLLINLVSYSVENRITIMEAYAPTDFGNQQNKTLATRALIDYFYKYEELARLVEQNTDDILNNPEKCDKNKYKSQEDVEETVSKLLQKAGNHMEHTFLASYVCLLIGNLIMECKQHEIEVRKMLRNQSFVDMVQITEKYYNFLNLTASSEQIHVKHMKETKRIIQFMKDCDLHPNDETNMNAEQQSVSVQQTSYSMHSANTYNASNTYSSTSNENLWASNSNANTNNTSNSLFNKLYFSGR